MKSTFNPPLGKVEVDLALPFPKVEVDLAPPFPKVDKGGYGLFFLYFRKYWYIL
jgi:hypothetical protein